MGKKKKKTAKKVRGLTEYGKYRKVIYIEPEEERALRRYCFEENVAQSFACRVALRGLLKLPPIED